MRFEGDRLRAILAYQRAPVAVRDEFVRVEVEYQDARAALSVLRRGQYYGIGHAKRIRFVQPESSAVKVVPWGAELDFGPPAGAGSHYISGRAGRTKHRARGAKQSKVLMPFRMNMSDSMTLSKTR